MPLSEKEILFSTLAESSPDCIKLFDTEGKLVFINKAGMEEHGFSNLEEAQHFIESMVLESQTSFKKAFDAALRGDSASIEIQHTEGGSNRDFCLESVTPVRDAHGAITGVLGISRDITLRKKMEEELHERIADLEKSNKLMIGRELKMMELKNEIGELKERLAPFEH